MNPSDFINKIVGLCEGLPLCIPLSVTIAQAALESGWGSSGLTVNANALFGIKADSSWKGKKYNSKTKEVYNGDTVYTTAYFRAYDSWGESIVDHDKFLTSFQRYKTAIDSETPEECCRALQAAGYATDPDYARKLINIIETYNLKQYDITATPSVMADKTVEILVEPGETLHIVVRCVT